MSEISVLSNQYEKLVDTSDKINNSVITLKKRNILNEGKTNELYPRLKVTTDELSNAKSILLSFLENVNKIMKGETQESDYIPSLILQDYKDKLSRNQFLQEDVNEIVGKLTKDEPIEEKNIVVLDDILSLLDIERSMLFRKLRTARG